MDAGLHPLTSASVYRPIFSLHSKSGRRIHSTSGCGRPDTTGHSVMAAPMGFARRVAECLSTSPIIYEVCSK